MELPITLQLMLIVVARRLIEETTRFLVTICLPGLEDLTNCRGRFVTKFRIILVFKFKNAIKDLDKVYALKEKVIDDPKQVLKIVSASKGASLISGVYELSSATLYKEPVNNLLLRTTISKSSKAS